MIKKHLNQIETSSGMPWITHTIASCLRGLGSNYCPEASNILTLNLTVPELPTFHLFFRTQRQLEIWRDAFIALNNNEALEKASEYEQEISEADEEEDKMRRGGTNPSSLDSYGPSGAYQTPPTEYSQDSRSGPSPKMPISLHVPVDIVLVIPVSSSMHALKITLLRDLLKFMIQSLGGRDRMGLVTFGSSSGAVPLVGMTNKAWPGWSKIIDSIKSASQKSPRTDPLEGTNTAMDLLMQRKVSNPLTSILVISDSSASETESVDYVVSRAEAAKYVSPTSSN